MAHPRGTNQIWSYFCDNSLLRLCREICESLCLVSLTNLISRSRSTVLVKLHTGGRKELTFEPGDHVAIFPANKASLVQELIDMMHEKPDPNQPIKIEVTREDSGKSRRQLWLQS